MTSIERNWLIRTSQNQVLGPVAKAKVLEFLQKGALGHNDEVSSGNGYWFHLREKDLVERYLLGDIPQSFNPISEAKSVFSRRENPDKTTSLNSAPANKTQVLSQSAFSNHHVPKNDDLEFPDITVVQKINSLSSSEVHADGAKIPNSDDLEFPDLNNLSSMPYEPIIDTISKSEGSSGQKKEEDLTFKVLVDEEVAHYPSNDDLDFPTLDNSINNKSEVSETPKTETLKRTSKNEDFENEDNDDISFELALEDKNAATQTMVAPKELVDDVKKDHKLEKTSPDLQMEIPEKQNEFKRPLREDSKMLNDRKEKLGRKPITNQRASDNKPHPQAAREIAPELKKRNDSYLFIVLVVLIILIITIFFYYYRVILNKPLPMP
jgi:hypothetical protein